MTICNLHRGTTPLLISLPHDGSAIPAEMAERMTESARKAPDTDWFVSRLYAFASEMGASLLVPHYSRYVIDLNRPQDDVSLYPGQNTTGLCPAVQFTGEPVYHKDQQPSSAEIAQRIDMYWRPYHQMLSAEIKRLHEQHGRVLLWEGHSIRSQLPFLFEGKLPDFNLGTVSGTSCRPVIQNTIEKILTEQSDYTWIANGRFKGGFITRHYGNPASGIDAIQLELAQCNYMDETRSVYDEHKAERLQELLRKLLQAALSNSTQ